MSARGAAALGAVVCAALVSCTSAPPRPPASPAAELQSPAAAIPADLDVALRVDLVQLRRLLGPAASGALDVEVADHGDAPARQLLADALGRADTVWVALRPGLGRDTTDNVIVLRGAFRDLDVRSYRGENPWGPAVDLGGDVRRHERHAPERRSAPARLYLHGDGLIVLLSEAEIDSVERRIEQRGGEPTVQPPERGTVSAAARVPPLLRGVADRFPSVVDALGDATRVEGHASLDAIGLRGSVEIRFPSATDAARAEKSAAALLERVALVGGLVRLVAAGLTLRAVGPALVLELTLGPDETARVVGCATRGLGCDEGG